MPTSTKVKQFGRKNY